ncbi:hypothetical protein D9758_013426 [Tetrapyrgos nigripes]|uniref:Uncharacterized protein n=1 Tax=Tetrapyrgos nigripes TaxID=182062 RepID=A0A8H5CKM7_9AGAR|nr:hypothetical protein D9758_013426 [Tetrapyrgos nigripes]
MSQSITITYTLHPPDETKPPTPEGGGSAFTPHKTIQVPVSSASSSTSTQNQNQSHSEYYAKLHNAIEDARNQIGGDLTLWRDAIGKAELVKESQTKKIVNGDDEDDEGEEEE